MGDELSDEFAREYVEAYDWVMRFHSGEATPEDITALREWCGRSPANKDAFQQLSRTWQSLGNVGAQMRAGEGGRNAASIPFPASSVPRRGVSRRLFLGGALAASAAGLGVVLAHPPMGLWPSWSEMSADYRTGVGEQRHISLENDVSIELNTRTSIAMYALGQTESRIEILGGEAMIATAPKGERTLSVQAGDGRIIASAARFNVRTDDHSVCVTCLAGEVRVERLAVSRLVPSNQQVIYSERGVTPPTTIDTAIVTAWQDGLVIFRSTPVTEVVAEINRYRPGRVILTNEALGRRIFNARFRKDDIGQVVGQIEQVFGAKVTKLPGGIILLG